MADITTGIITDGTLEGAGIFDVLMRAVNLHILKEYQMGRVTATDYSTVYLGALQAAMSSSIQYALSAGKANEEIKLLAAKTVSETAQTVDTAAGVLGAQTALYKKQKDGFDRDAEQKSTKIIADVYAVQRSTDEGLAPPVGLDNAAATSAANKMLEGIGII